MIDRSELITRLGEYARECMVSTASVADDITRRSAAMKAVEDWCAAAILAEREACAAMADDEGEAGDGHAVADRIRARATP